jgi:predicted PurR-regulated permease PerM
MAIWRSRRPRMVVAQRDEHAGAPPPDSALPREPPRMPISIEMPVGVRSVALAGLAAVAFILLLRYAQEVVIPVVLAVLISYALDPLVLWFQRWRLPRVLATTLVLALVVGLAAATVYNLRYQAVAVIDQLPDAARKLRDDLRRKATGGTAETALEKVQEAATEIEKTAAAAAAPSTAPRGITRVQVEEPAFKAADYLWWGSMGLLAFIAQAAMIFFLVFFLLASGDLYRRKLVKIAGPTLTKKRITVEILDDITARIERFLIVQVFTSILVGVATAMALWWMGLNEAGFWGLMAGLFNSIPYFGPVVVSGGLAVIGYMQFASVPMALWVAAVSMAITTLEGWLITPSLMGKAAQMSPAAIFIGLIFWSWMWGVWGLLLAVPLMMVTKAVCDHVEDLQWLGEMLGD